MSKHLRKLGLGLALGGLLGHYLTTPKGQALKKRLGQEWQAYQDNPALYTEQLKDQVQAYAQKLGQTVQEAKDELVKDQDPMIIDGEFEEANQVTDEDIIITFEDEDLL